MIADHLTGIEQFEADLWKVADNLRANSNLAWNEYFMPILGLIFLRHATNRYYEAMVAIEEDRAAGRMPERPLVEADFTRRRSLMLPEAACYDVLLEMPKDGNLGAAVTGAMETVEDHFPPLAGQLPKDYERFEDDVLEEMMRTFDSEALRTDSGDVFGPHLFDPRTAMLHRPRWAPAALPDLAVRHRPAWRRIQQRAGCPAGRSLTRARPCSRCAS